MCVSVVSSHKCRHCMWSCNSPYMHQPYAGYCLFIYAFAALLFVKAASHRPSLLAVIAVSAVVVIGFVVLEQWQAYGECGAFAIVAFDVYVA